MLADRETNEAYLAAKVGHAYALYFPDGGEVRVDLSAVKELLTAHWINIASGEWGPTQELAGGGRISVAPPDKGNWAVAILKGK